MCVGHYSGLSNPQIDLRRKHTALNDDAASLISGNCVTSYAYLHISESFSTISSTLAQRIHNTYPGIVYLSSTDILPEPFQWDFLRESSTNRKANSQITV